MPTDLDTLLRDAGGDPTTPLDVDALWAGGRRRRTLRRLSTASGGLVGVAALVLVASSVLSGLEGPAVPQIEPMAPTAGASTALDADATDDATTDATDEPSTSEQDAAEPQRLGEEPAPLDGSTSGSAEASGDSLLDPASAPSPDPGRVTDPCAVHADGEMRAFIDVVSPVADQQVGGSFDLVGCSSVPEGTIRYRLSRGGTVVVDHVTTATAGGPGIGEFRETIPLSATGAHTLEVFWDSPVSDRPEQDLTTVGFHAG